MKNLLQVLFLGILFNACQKTTDVQGTFTNYATGLPIKGIRVALFASKDNGKGYPVFISQDADSTDENGKYSLHVEAKSADIILNANIPNGFVEPKMRYIKNGKTRTEDFALKPYDAYLRLTLQHDSSSGSKVYYYFSGPLYEDQTYPVNPEGLTGIDIPLGESKTFVHLVPGGQTINIIWDTHKFVLYKNPFPHTTTVECPRNDTTDFVLKY
jgi:hypothetical protein